MYDITSYIDIESNSNKQSTPHQPKKLVTVCIPVLHNDDVIINNLFIIIGHSFDSISNSIQQIVG